MSTLPTPDHDGFASAEEAEAYDRWFRAKVQKSMDDPRPGIPHDVVMAKVAAIIEAKLKAQRSNHASPDLESGS
jgi:hypothetical protein